MTNNKSLVIVAVSAIAVMLVATALLGQMMFLQAKRNMKRIRLQNPKPKAKKNTKDVY
jgi:hypothetical protein